MSFDVFARAELESFFCRREEHGKFYCRACLVQQLSDRGARKITVAAWTVATKETFVNPGLLQVRFGTCEICKRPGHSIGTQPVDIGLEDQQLIRD